MRSQKASHPSRWIISPSSRNETKHSLKVTERSGNVYENKGSAWKESKEAGMAQKPSGSYAFVAGVLCSKMDDKSIIRSGTAAHAPKLTERSWNVYENKGSAWKGSELSLNLIENKGTYTFSCAIYLKIKELYLSPARFSARLGEANQECPALSPFPSPRQRRGVSADLNGGRRNGSPNPDARAIPLRGTPLGGADGLGHLWPNWTRLGKPQSG